MKPDIGRIKYHLFDKKVTIAPLVTFRILFGILMLFSVIRFWLNGWIHTQYIEPRLYFPFIEGLRPIEGQGMYGIFFLIGLSALMISLGYFYRIFTTLFFVLFTYVELLDKTNYLNHYYFISLVSFLLVFLPAHRNFSLDVSRGVVTSTSKIQVIYINVIKLQLGIVYFFAGIAKINYDWLFNAQPLKLWLSSKVHLPIIGWVLRYKVTAYIFSWFGMLFDTTIPFFLAFKRTMPYAYIVVVIFHLTTGVLFPIGVFPLVMILGTTIFFPASFHEKVINRLSNLFRYSRRISVLGNAPKTHMIFFVAFFCVQVLIPLRYLMMPGNVFWSEQGYRFSWRVMLMEKAGDITFFVEDGDRKHMVANYEYLTPQQEKMMSTQPDMILQFVRFLEKEFEEKGFKDPKITARSYVTLNGRPSRPFINPEIDLSKVSLMQSSRFILPYD